MISEKESGKKPSPNRVPALKTRFLEPINLSKTIQGYPNHQNRHFNSDLSHITEELQFSSSLAHYYIFSKIRRRGDDTQKSFIQTKNPFKKDGSLKEKVKPHPTCQVCREEIVPGDTYLSCEKCKVVAVHTGCMDKLSPQEVHPPQNELAGCPEPIIGELRHIPRRYRDSPYPDPERPADEEATMEELPSQAREQPQQEASQLPRRSLEVWPQEPGFFRLSQN